MTLEQREDWLAAARNNPPRIPIGRGAPGRANRLHLVLELLLGRSEPSCHAVKVENRFKAVTPPTSDAGSGRVNLVPLPAVVTSPRDMALAAVICSALATVLLALLVLCVIYCKRQLLEKKPSGESRR